MQKDLFVISLGGSLIFPEEIDTMFLKQFKQLILSQTQKGKRFIIIAGGGKICRKYQSALKILSKPHNTDLDWMGIYNTKTNANFIRLMFGSLAHSQIAGNPLVKLPFKNKILIGAGFLPGHSTDMDAVQLAFTYGAKTVINLSNIDFLFSKDPKKYKDAKKITNISWDGLLKITGKKWVPGKNVPFDPKAALYAKKHGIKAIIAGGKNLKNLKAILEGKKFVGTEIK